MIDKVIIECTQTEFESYLKFKKGEAVARVQLPYADVELLTESEVVRKMQKEIDSVKQSMESLIDFYEKQESKKVNTESQSSDSVNSKSKKWWQ